MLLHQYDNKYINKISFYSITFIVVTLLFQMTLSANTTPTTPMIHVIHVSQGSTEKPLLAIQHPFSATAKNQVIVAAITVKQTHESDNEETPPALVLPRVTLSNTVMHPLMDATQQVISKSARFQVYWYYLLEAELPSVTQHYKTVIEHDNHNNNDDHYINAGVMTLSNVSQAIPEVLAKKVFNKKKAQTLRTPVKTLQSEMMLLDLVVADKGRESGQLVPDYLQKILWNTRNSVSNNAKDNNQNKEEGGQAAVSARRLNTAQDTSLIWRWKSFDGDLNTAATSVIAFKSAIAVSPVVDAGEDQTLSVWRGPKPVSKAQRPAYLQAFTDPVYHSTITRVTDESQDGYNKNTATLRHNYPNDSVWNTDMSLIKLNFGQIRDAKTYKLVRFISKDQKTGKSYDEILWSNINPKILYGLNANSFSRYSLETGEWTILRTFEGYGKLTTDYMSSLSNDDRYIALNDKKRILVYDLIDDEITATLPMGKFTTASMSQSGRYVLLTSKNGFFAYDQNVKAIKKVAEKSNHDDFGYDADGNEVVIQMCPARMVQIDNGKVTDLLGLSYVCGHVSARNYKKPGWAYISSNLDTNDNHYGPYIATEIMEVKLDDSGIVNTLAHSRTTSHDYESHALIVVSPDGSQVIVGSDWGDEDATVYDYVINNKNRPFAQTKLHGHVNLTQFSSINLVQMTWHKVSGKGQVTFENNQAVDTNVTFSDKGRYVLQLRVSNGEQSIADEVVITVGINKFLSK